MYCMILSTIDQWTFLELTKFRDTTPTANTMSSHVQTIAYIKLPIAKL
jgi:hypothetical protein